MAVKKFLPVIQPGTSRFEETVIIGNTDMRSQTPEDTRELQLVYRHEQARQLRQEIERMDLNPDDIEFYGVEFEKNMCPSTAMENESGILYNRRTGVSVSVMLEWVCEWGCSVLEWTHEYEPTLQKCKPVYFIIGLTDNEAESLR